MYCLACNDVGLGIKRLCQFTIYIHPYQMAKINAFLPDAHAFPLHNMDLNTRVREKRSVLYHKLLFACSSFTSPPYYKHWAYPHGLGMQPGTSFPLWTVWRILTFMHNTEFERRGLSISARWSKTTMKMLLYTLIAVPKSGFSWRSKSTLKAASGKMSLCPGILTLQRLDRLFIILSIMQSPWQTRHACWQAF